MTDLTQKIDGVVLSEQRSISPDEDAKKDGIKKTITLKISYDGLTLGDVLAKAFKSDVVAWQNGSGGRKNFDNIVDGSTIEVSAKAPGSLKEDPETAMIRKLQAMTPEEQVAYLKEIAAKASK